MCWVFKHLSTSCNQSWSVNVKAELNQEGRGNVMYRMDPLLIDKYSSSPFSQNTVKGLTSSKSG